MSASTDDLRYQVRTTLDGDPNGNFDVAAIVSDLTREFGPLDSIDSVPSDAYWATVARHDLTA